MRLKPVAKGGTVVSDNGVLSVKGADEVVLDVLPSLPSAWDAKGSVTGLKGRGAFVVSFSWVNGRATHVAVDSLKGIPAVIRFNGREERIPAEKGMKKWYE